MVINAKDIKSRAKNIKSREENAKNQNLLVKTGK